ncbi:MAG: SLBB domain-containing protein [Candidatus Gastranaerophilales bacterium]|nr:SLBB domain-containing protein [Candidatus Gastranaerophilales bacterium]
MKKYIFSLILTFITAAVIPCYAVIENRTDTNNYQEIYEEVQPNAFGNKYQSTASKSPKSYDLSPIEDLFNGKDVEINGNILRQAGYDLFGSAPSSAATAGKYDSSYKLSIGEKVNVYLQGDSVDIMTISGSSVLNPSTKAEVDSKGNLFVQGIGMVPAEGRTISSVESALNRLASQKYNSLKVTLNIASGQEFSVFVFGNVKKPGKILVGNNSTVFDALNMAGGIKKTGSLRNIDYTSSGKKKQNIDLYKTIFLGEDDGIILRPNDKIFVNKIGNVIALKNGVLEPGIYEAKDKENIQNIVNYAGGFAPSAQITEVTLISFDKNLKEKTAQNMDWSDAVNTKVQNGDSVEFKELYNNAENIITIQGNIKHPATYAYKDGMRLSDILTSEDELLEETFINQAVIRRISGKDNTIETIPVFLLDFFQGINDPLLQPRDIITIYKNTNSQFVDVYGCINKPKHLTYIDNMTLDDVMSDIQFLESNIDNENNGEKPVSYNPNQGKITLSGEMSSENKLIPAENVAVEIIKEDGSTTLYYLYDIMINSDRIKSIQIDPKDKIFFRTLRSNEIMKSVKVSGFVKQPGVYTSIKDKNLTDIIEMAGGLAEDADLRGIVFKRANLQNKQVIIARKNNDRDIKLLEGRIASAYKASESDQQTKMDMISMLKEEEKELTKRYSGQIALNIKSNDLTKIKDIDNIEIQDGDDIYIPRISNQVSIMGEVYNEQSFAYKKGSKVKYYINEVGGYTPNANKFRLYKVGVNGRAEKVSRHSSVNPGDVIVVPRRIAGNDWITPICDTLRGLASIVVMAFAINKW